MMTIDFLIGAIRASRDLHPQVKTELEEILNRAEPVEPVPNRTLRKLGWDDAMNCGACGWHLRTFAKFCDSCGKPVLVPERMQTRAEFARKNAEDFRKLVQADG